MRLAFTIDVEARDHPCENGNFRAMVDALGDAGAPATLFVQGGWVEGRATDDEIWALAAEGMVVGLHGHTHRRFTELSADEIDDELARAEAALTRARDRAGPAVVPPAVSRREHRCVRAADRRRPGMVARRLPRGRLRLEGASCAVTRSESLAT